MKILITFVGVAVASGLLSACASAPDLLPTPQYAPVFPVAAVQPRAATGSLFVDGRGESLFGRQKDYHVGDIITVLLNEADIMASASAEYGAPLSVALSKEWEAIGFAPYATVATASGRRAFLSNIQFSSYSGRTLSAVIPASH